MADTKWSPAPWVEDNGVVSGRDSHNPDLPSFDIFDADDSNIPEAEALANAHLIAAAPTMATYIIRKAEEGCPEALKIMETINA